MRIVVNVTEEDIKNGKRCAPDSCPISLAIKRTIGEGTIVKTGRAWITVNGKDFYHSKKTMDFVRNFDREKLVTPFKFQLERIPNAEN